MSRKGNTPQRSVLPDPKHGSETIARFINMVMQSGKKSVAEKIVYGAMETISEKNPNPLELVEKLEQLYQHILWAGDRITSFFWRASAAARR